MLYANKKALNWSNNQPDIIRNEPVVNPYTYQLGIMCYCVITRKATIKFRTNTSQTFMLLLVTHSEPNVYYIQLLNKDKIGNPKVVNRCQLFDLKRSEPPSVASTSPNGDSAVPSFLLPNLKLNLYNNNSSNNNNLHHHYNTRSKRRAATAGRQVEVNTIVTYL